MGSSKSLNSSPSIFRLHAKWTGVKMTDPKPTIRELEEILEDDGALSVSVNPDGSITTDPNPKPALDLDDFRSRAHRLDFDELDDQCLNEATRFVEDAIQLCDELRELREEVERQKRIIGYQEAEGTRLRKQAEDLAEALEFYADEDRYDEGMGGSVARAALAKFNKEEP
jgi:hypothetical protein